MSRITKKQAEELVSDWNEKYPPPAAVILTDDHGAKHRTCTRSAAWTLCNGTPVVKVAGHAGGYLLTRLVPIEEATTPQWVEARQKLDIVNPLLTDATNEIRDNCASPIAPDFGDLYDTWQDLKAASELLRQILLELARDADERKLVKEP